jgi:plasmid stabilization system protein ParE
LTRKTVRIHPAALEEAEAATEWYVERSRRAAERFLDELDQALERIAENPQQFAEYVYGTRCMVLRRFPYVVVFRAADAAVEIVAIAHGRRRPGYWRDRL